jgi:gamma-D-glutamyl-L-lysine dipeptidyl-peptidase
MSCSTIIPRVDSLLRAATLLAVLPVVVSCASSRTSPHAADAPATTTTAAAARTTVAVEEAIAAVRAEYAPDRRVARFDVEASHDDGVIVVTGETTAAAARAAFAHALAARAIAYRDETMVLPDPALGDRTWALANNSVANLRTIPGHSSELSTQVLLGTPLRVLRQQNGFYLVQTPEGYLSWVDGGGIRRMTEAQLRAYEAAPKIIFTRSFGMALSGPRADAEPVADLVLGAILELADPQPASGGYYHARMPDGRTAYVSITLLQRPTTMWVAGAQATESSLVAVARTFMGVPYLWGGTSAKGVDCSGFTKMIYLMNGLILPRDASQQVHIGTLVDDRGDFGSLRVGDLLFFGRPAADGAPERVVHVGMWIGDGRFIHASGRVHISSVDPAAPTTTSSTTAATCARSACSAARSGVKALRDAACSASDTGNTGASPDGDAGHAVAADGPDEHLRLSGGRARRSFSGSAASRA